MSSDLFRRLTAFKLELADIEEVVAWHFGNTRFHDDRAEFSHGSPLLTEPALTLFFDRNRKFRDAKAGPSLRESDVSEIEGALEAVVITSKLFTMQRHVFSDIRIGGTYRYRNEFQIVPVHRDAPQPKEWYGKWPFILEFNYLGTEHVAIDDRRCAVATSKLISLLNALADAHIFPISRSSEKEWVMTPSGGSYYAQVGYTYPLPPGAVFTQIDDLPAIRRISADAYYAGQVDNLHGFTLPDDIDEMLDNYHAMSSTDRDAFDVAAHWYGRYPELATISGSAGLVALVTALEALAPSALSHACPKCGHIDGVVRGFHILLDNAVPGHEEGKHQFYKLRSQIAHGSGLLLNEFGGMGGGTAAQMQDSSKEDLHIIVRLALRNWLIPEVREAIASQALSGG
jgi:hypothetical protein